MPPLKWGTGHVLNSELGPHFVGENSYECPHFNGFVGALSLPSSLSLSFSFSLSLPPLSLSLPLSLSKMTANDGPTIIYSHLMAETNVSGGRKKKKY